MIAIHVAPASDGRPGRARAPSDDAGSTPREEAPRILVVEDEWLVSSEIEATLEDEGYVVVGVAVSATEAVSMAEMHRPDLVSMDVRLAAGCDGVDAAIEIYSRFGIRCIFVSANRDPATQERAQAANSFGWVPKPFSATQLLDAVRDALRAE